MSATNDGGPAFPHFNPDTEVTHPGMSLRDWFAGQALNMLADPKFNEPPKDTASLAYRLADAMLAAREVKP